MAEALRLLASRPTARSTPLLNVAAAMDGVPLRRVATMVGCSQAHIYALASGHSLPSLKLARSLAAYYGVDIDTLFPQRVAS